MSANRSQPQALSRGRILAVVLIYAVFAASWILLSDRFIQLLFTQPEQLMLISMFKGWLFVGITSLLLYGLMRRWLGGAEESHQQPPRRKWLVPFILLVIAIVLSAVFGILLSYKQHKTETINRLEEISDAKSRQISAWLQERKGDAEFIHSSDFLAGLYQQWQSVGDVQSGERLKNRLEQLSSSRGFAGVGLLDAHGQPVWHSSTAPQALATALAPQLDSTATLSIGNPYRDAHDQTWQDFVVPLSAIPGLAARVILHVNLSKALFSELQSWPSPSDSGEIVLVQRVGEQLHFLNELRFRAKTATALALDLNTPQLLSGQAIRGQIPMGKAVEGLDYRGVPSLGVVRSIAGSDWFLVAKMDKSELYALMTTDAVWISLVAVLALFSGVVGFYLLGQNQQLALAQAIQQVQNERLQALNLLGVIADSSDDAIFAKDLEGRYMLFNRAASQFVGKPVEEVLGFDDRAIFPAEQAERLMAKGQLILDEDRIQTEEDVLDTTEGVKTFLSTRGPLRDAQGHLLGLFGISRDITERKQALLAVQDSESRFHTLFENASVAIIIHDANNGEVVEANRRALEIYAFTSLEEFKNLRLWLDSPYSRQDAQQLIRKTVSEGPQRFEWQSRDRHGRLFWQEVLLNTINLNGIERVLSMATDINARKAAEAILQQQTEELAARNAELERFNRATVGRELDMIALKQQINTLAGQLGQKPLYALSFLDSTTEHKLDSTL